MLSSTPNTKSASSIQKGTNSSKTRLDILKYVPILLIASFFIPIAFAEPLTNQSNTANEVALDPQAAPSPNSPFIETPLSNTPFSGETTTLPDGLYNGEVSNDNNLESNSLNPNSPDALANPNSLASQMHPSDMDLSAANQQLLSQNAQLQRDANALETRVNVLINERSGQLFMYGAIVVSIALFAGFMLGWFVFGRRERW